MAQFAAAPGGMQAAPEKKERKAGSKVRQGSVSQSDAMTGGEERQGRSSVGARRSSSGMMGGGADSSNGGGSGSGSNPPNIMTMDRSLTDTASTRMQAVSRRRSIEQVAGPSSDAGDLGMMAGDAIGQGMSMRRAVRGGGGEMAGDLSPRDQSPGTKKVVKKSAAKKTAMK